jgi:putative ABC transport system permease protein|tara:strand:- start:10185 stop:11396 length:1212 start_codon:yes stop_codon:yes gene_type:complete
MMDYFLIAYRNLKKRGIRSWLTLLGVFIGIVAVISLITLGAGLQSAVNAQFGISSTEVITVQAGGLNSYGAPGSGVVNFLTVEDVEEIAKLSVVNRAIRRNMPTGKLEFNDIVGFGMAMSVPSGDDRKFAYDMLELEPELGRLLKDGDTNKVLLGYNFYGDDDMFGKPIVPGNKILLQEESFEIVGVLEKKGLLFDNMVLVNEGTLEDLMGYGDNVDLIAVHIKDKDLMDKAKEDIEKVLRKTRDVKKGEEDFEVTTPDAMMESVNSILGAIQAFIIIIASISILVGVIGIVNTMTTSVLERRKEIGIMKAIGAKNSQVFMQFFVESGLMGLVGGALGVIVGMIIGYAGTLGINNFLGAEAVPQINFFLIFFTLLGSFLIGSIAGIIPAMSAARQNPVEALRG